MKSLLNYLLIGLVILVGAGCNDGSNSAEAVKDSNAVKMDSTTADSTKMIPATVSKADQDFSVNTAIAGMTEIKRIRHFRNEAPHQFGIAAMV